MKLNLHYVVVSCYSTPIVYFKVIGGRSGCWALRTKRNPKKRESAEGCVCTFIKAKCTVFSFLRTSSLLPHTTEMR